VHMDRSDIREVMTRSQLHFRKGIAVELPFVDEILKLPCSNFRYFSEQSFQLSSDRPERISFRYGHDAPAVVVPF
jgi:hypothetical protein